MADTALLDVDGTLVDTNYQHALAWFRAFRRFDHTVPIWRIHRAVGMGGDQLVPAVAGDEFERAHGDDAREAWVEEFDPLLPEVQPFDGARDLVAELGRRGWKVVLASSGKQKHVDAFLDLLDARELCEAWTSSEDADATKPAPDLFQVALQRVGGGAGVVLGDSSWDVEAAAKAGMPAVAVRTGGYSVEELRDAGAAVVHDSMRGLLDGLDSTPLAAPSP
ncbi:HAD family hydrolase [Paenibacillus sp. TRM 82003]|uniref:HAD family hydrolase n=1 Tax=Kineococcus sp. TRM81007 TaxID=2925831 RepID=UPI001F560092|nr:HAD family hydrolase [Kineococcus sp. TRM81007]MCI2239601.1 HAD family hydrolase [Kineococcus sp. TRM81007]MCI3926117.1 HAD family hydrolase [Paenibacillus sp. TRM 82003]